MEAVKNRSLEYRVHRAMEDLKLQFRDFVIPSAPSLLYEQQSSPPRDLKRKASSIKMGGFTINLSAFIERSKTTSRISPAASVTRRR